MLSGFNPFNKISLYEYFLLGGDGFCGKKKDQDEKGIEIIMDLAKLAYETLAKESPSFFIDFCSMLDVD